MSSKTTFYKNSRDILSDHQVMELRTHFPILQTEVNGKPLVYLDNAATTQKPTIVIKAITDYYEKYNSNIHRGAHYLAAKATEAYEEARKTVAKFVGAASDREINFTRGTTESINLVASGLAKGYLKEGDEILITGMEHHSNIVPWQMACEQTGAKLKFVPVSELGEIDLEEYKSMLSDRVKVVSAVWISNSLGTINPIEDMIALAHQAGALFMVDAAQAAPHTTINVQTLDCDFLAFSSHKVYGPTGVGILYGKEEELLKLPPYQGGGEMIKTVSFEKTTYNDLPFKFEAGTPNICGGIALGAALNYVLEQGREAISKWEMDLVARAEAGLSEIAGLRLYSRAKKRAAVVSFAIKDIHSYDLGVLLDQMGIAVRTGHHCCQPLMNRFGIEGTCRASFAMYNTPEEVDKFVAGIKRAQSMLV